MNDAPEETLIRLVLLDESGLFRASLGRFLASHPGLKVTGQCGTSTEALNLLASVPPDVILLDFEFGPERGNDFITAARKAGYQGRFLIIAGKLDVRECAIALKLGASGIFLKSETAERLLQAIRLVAAGEVWIDQKVIHLLADRLADPPRLLDTQADGVVLEERERNVLLGIVGGFSNRKIGDRMGLSESSVKNVVQKLFAKAGVNTRSQLVRIALEGSLGVAASASARNNEH
jgi:DNA-binding NarL/FixJ family response regulator